jgi:hypothetical protein
MRGYLFAYEGKLEEAKDHPPAIYIGDFMSDRPVVGGAKNIAPGLVAGKLLLEFGKLYKENYLDKGNLIPIYAEARDATSYQLLTRQLESLGERTGYRFEMQQTGDHRADSSKMHHVLITPYKA